MLCLSLRKDFESSLFVVLQGLPVSGLLSGSCGSLTPSVSLRLQHLQTVARLSEVGRLYHEVETFTRLKAEDGNYDLVGHNLVTGVREELTENYRRVAALEGEVPLLQLQVWLSGPTQRLRLLVEVVRGVGGAQWGSPPLHPILFPLQGGIWPG